MSIQDWEDLIDVLSEPEDGEQLELFEEEE